jgi:hypothetical protein
MTPERSAYMQRWYKENQERIKTHAKKYRTENPNVIMYQRVKGRAKRMGIPFDLELEDIVIPDHCPIFNVPFVIGEKSPWNPSLDRIVPEKGYTKGNVVVISYRANSIKNDATPEELRKVADFVDLLLVSRYAS